MKKTILISGATSGFGEATARLFSNNGHGVILTGRRKDRLEQLKKELEANKQNEVHTLCFDIQNQPETAHAIDGLPERWKSIDVLINNAGLASGFSKIQDGDVDDWERMIDTNVKGLLYLSKAVIPLMLRKKSGHIVNIGSTAGKEVYEKGNVYCASKHAVDALTKSMRIDLLEYGIKVTQIAPGAAETEFSKVRFHGDESKAKHVYQGYAPMSAENIASIVHYVTSLPDNVCINDLVVTSLAQANSFYTHRK
jgi:3-hydroxy acid dehydrogenase/malonic semialdehyde reductase